MRAAKWKLEDGKKRIKSTIEWRREYKPELIEPGDVSVEAESGKMYIFHASSRGLRTDEQYSQRVRCRGSTNFVPQVSMLCHGKLGLGGFPADCQTW